MEKETLLNRDEEASTLADFMKGLQSKDAWKKNDEIEAYNICLDAKWGDGKTTFINNFLIPKLKSNRTYDDAHIINISAWEYDYLKDPLELVFDILSQNESLCTKIFDKLKDIGIGFAQSFIDSIFIADEFKLLTTSVSNIKKRWNFKKNRMPNIVSQNTLLKEIKKILKPDETDEKKDKIRQYLVIIEDLDRCKPEFARNVFEIMKHVFNSLNFTVLYVCDWNLMNTMISNKEYISGSNEQYLDKIIDFVFTLKTLNIGDYFFGKYLAKFNNSFEMQVISDKQSIFVKKHFCNIKSTEKVDYFNDVLRLKPLREQNMVYYTLMSMFERQKIFLSKKQVRFPELDAFLLSNYLHHPNDHYGNIFYQYFNNKNKNIDDEVFIYITEAIMCVLLSVENKPAKNTLKVSDIADIPEDFDDRWVAAETFSNLTISETMEKISTEQTDSWRSLFLGISKFLKKQMIMQILNTWFQNEYEKCPISKLI